VSSELKHSYSIFIQATPQQVWEALTISRFTTQYFFNSAVESDWKKGSDYAMTSPDGAIVKFEGRILASDPPRRLFQTVNVKWDPALVGHQEMTIDWDIEQFGETCRVTISHRGSDSDARLFEMLTGHCPDVLSGMKTLLETGKPLRIGPRVGAEA
jgi:uncharacterized protein YndB with AHSA1/START domain